MLWSEEAALVVDDKEEKALLDWAKDAVKSSSTVLGVTYERHRGAR